MKYGETDVYCAYGDTGVLVYVGISDDAFRRLREHSARSVWWEFAERIVIERYEDRWTAQKQEAFMIAMDNPIFNISKEQRAFDAAWDDAHNGVYYTALGEWIIPARLIA